MEWDDIIRQFHSDFILHRCSEGDGVGSGVHEQGGNLRRREVWLFLGYIEDRKFTQTSPYRNGAEPGVRRDAWKPKQQKRRKSVSSRE